MDEMINELEKDIQKSILDLFEYRGIHANKVNTVGIKKPNGKFIPSQNVGMSDIIGLTRSGRYFAIEVKRKGGRLTDKQSEFQEIIRANNGIAFVAYSLEDVLDNKELWK